MQNIKLQSYDGEVIEVDVDIARYSIIIKTMMEDLEPEEDLVVLPKVRSDILSIVFEWVAHHHLYQTGLLVTDGDQDNTDDYISYWDKQFLKMHQSTLFEIISAASYLNIRGLLNVTCKYVAGMIKGKSTEEIRATFNIVNDFTEAEEEEVRRMYNI